MHTRKSALDKWLNQVYPDKPFSLTPLAGDASFRRYFRLKTDDTSRIIMDAPPDKEPLSPFISIAEALTNMGVHTPKMFQSDEHHGFLILEDLGDELLLNSLSPHRADELYQEAMNALIQIQRHPSRLPELPVFDKQFMLEQMQLFQIWFLENYLGLTLTPEEEDILYHAFEYIADSIQTQPYCFTHCDYHSRNLMLVPNVNRTDIGVIDFQDAMWGPFSYDLVSLLKDCYTQWPEDKRRQWITYFFNRLDNHHNWTLEAFAEGVELCGLQRHLKVLGVFSRLHIRDNKSAYLNDLPLVLSYVLESLSTSKPLQPLNDFMKQAVLPAFQKVQAL